jgi:hypothetical protein
MQGQACKQQQSAGAAFIYRTGVELHYYNAARLDNQPLNVEFSGM